MGIFLDFLRWIPAYFFPKTCYGCGKEGSYVCSDCKPKIERVFDHPVCSVCQRPSTVGATHERCRTRNRLDGLTSFYRYDGWAKRMMHDAKFGHPPLFAPITALATEFAPILESRLHQIFGIDMNQLSIVPVPLHWWRERKRGYNQALLIAETLATGLQAPLAPLLLRTRYTQPQTLVGRRSQTRERRTNVHGAFGVDFGDPRRGTDFGDSVIPSKILLIDDVWTTGATMTECCKVLKRAGVRWVWGVTLLRA